MLKPPGSPSVGTVTDLRADLNTLIAEVERGRVECGKYRALCPAFESHPGMRS